MSEKAALRQQFKAYRKELSEKDFLHKSAAIVNNIKTLPELQQAQTVHVYWPMVAEHEVDIRPLIDWLEEAGNRIVLPVIERFGRYAGGPTRLTTVLYEGRDRLQVNAWGIHEPIGQTGVPLEEVDAVVVPSLGLGRNGHRIGHGMGYYDELLGYCLGVPLIAPNFAACLVEAVPTEAHDIPMTVVCTETEIYRPDLA